MYFAYWKNLETGEVFRSSQPQDNPTGYQWARIGELEYRALQAEAKLAAIEALPEAWKKHADAQWEDDAGTGYADGYIAAADELAAILKGE